MISLENSIKHKTNENTQKSWKNVQNRKKLKNVPIFLEKIRKKNFLKITLKNLFFHTLREIRQRFPNFECRPPVLYFQTELSWIFPPYQTRFSIPSMKNKYYNFSYMTLTVNTMRINNSYCLFPNFFSIYSFTASCERNQLDTHIFIQLFAPPAR